MVSCLLMVVDYFYVFGTVGAFRPFKTNAPLLVDTDAVLPLAIAAKRFKVVAGKGGKILQGCCRLQRRKLLDRMIAAQALVHRATLVTFNPDDFSDVPGLSSLVWPSK